MKKGFTIVELVISMALLAIILVAVSSIFITAIKNYQISFARSTLQKEINFTVDDINKNIRIAAGVESTNGSGDNRGPNTLILSLPATDANGNFIYQSGVLQVDTFTYSLSSGNLHKKIKSTTGTRLAQNNSDVVILNNVVNTLSDPIFSYLPSDIPRQVQINLKVGRTVEKTNIRLTGSRLTDLRNKN
jgi:prepilin-type N-terminal cleavage/methylation domain-containing protein